MPGLPDFYDTSSDRSAPSPDVTEPMYLGGNQPDKSSGSKTGEGNASINQPTEPNINSPKLAASVELSEGSAEKIANSLSASIGDKAIQAEVILVNSVTGERKTVSSSGGKVITAMSMQ